MPRVHTGEKRPRVGADTEADASDSNQLASTSAVSGSRSDPSKYPRKRASVACEVCRLRKTRCDASRPRCSFCTKVDIDCVYRQANPSPQLSSDQADVTSTQTSQQLSSLLTRVEVLLQARENSAGTVEEVAACAGIAPTPLQYTQPVPEADWQATLAVPIADMIDAEQPSDQFVAWTHQTDQTDDSPAECDFEVIYHPEVPCLVGLSLYSFARIAQEPCPAHLQPLLFDDGEDYLEQEQRYFHAVFDPTTMVTIQELQLDFKTCWKNQQAFSKNVLPWIPIFDQQVCAKVVQEGLTQAFSAKSPATSLALYILALGALSKADDDDSTSASFCGNAGFGYFRAASAHLDTVASSPDTMVVSQCFVLKACYLLLCLRTLAAFDAVHTASTIIARQMARKKWLSKDPALFETCHRVYWVCYIIEHELRVVVHYGTELHQYERLALPLSRSHEPGFFWLLSEIALRQIYVNGLIQVGGKTRALYAPRIAQELISQLDQWYEHLDPAVKFSLGPEPILDTQKAFLRAQYHSAIFQFNWSYVVQWLSVSHDDKSNVEKHALLQGVKESINHGLLAIRASKSVCQDRHVLLFTNLFCVAAIAMMLLCIVDVPEFMDLHKVNDTIDTIKEARDMIAYWAKRDAVMHTHVKRLEELMRAKDVG